MKIWTLAFFSVLIVGQVRSVGSNCGSLTYFLNPSFSASATPTKGSSTTFTLTGTTPVAVSLSEWDLFVNFNGAITQQYDVSVSGNFTANSQVVVKYTLVTSSSAQSGYYNMRFLLQNTQGFYISCWSYAYSLSG